MASWCATPSHTELSQPPPAEYSVARYEDKNPLNIKMLTPEAAEALAYEKADKYDLGAKGLREKFVATMRKESYGFTVIDGQSKIPDSTGPNGHENSWGIPQFWLDMPMETPEGRPITKEQAQDPEKALDIAAWHFAKGDADRWTAYRDLK